MAGRVIVRQNPDQAKGAIARLYFYGIKNYKKNPTAYQQNVQIDTPLTHDANGNLYFGFLALGATPLNLQSGVVAAHEGCIVDCDVLVVCIEPETLRLIVVGGVILHGSIAHLKQFESAHCPVIEGCLRAAPVVVITLVRVKECNLIPPCLESNASVVTGGRVLNCDVAGSRNAQSSRIVPEHLYLVDENVCAAAHGRAALVNAGVRVTKNEPAKSNIASPRHLQSMVADSSFHNRCLHVRLGWRPRMNSGV